MPWAESIHLIDVENRDKNSAVLCNIGYLTTEVSYISGDGLLALNSFSLGGGHIAYDLSYGIKVPYDTACFVKSNIDFNVQEGKGKNIDIRTNNGTETFEQDYINMIACARLEEIVNKINAIIKSYNIEYPKYLKLYLTGRGIADMKGVRSVIAELSGRACDIINLSYNSSNTTNMQTTATCLMKVVCDYDKSENLLLKLLRSWKRV